MRSGALGTNGAGSRASAYVSGSSRAATSCSRRTTRSPEGWPATVVSASSSTRGRTSMPTTVSVGNSSAYATAREPRCRRRGCGHRAAQRVEQTGKLRESEPGHHRGTLGGTLRRSARGGVPSPVSRPGPGRAAPVSWPLVEQRALGRSGLVVSRLALGTMTWGRDTDEDEAAMQLTAFVDAGGTLVDTADVYCDGESERTLGHLLTDVVPRSDVLVATKAVGRTRPGADGARRLPRAPARRARRLAGAAGPGLRRPLAAARLGRRHAARGDAGRLRPRRLLRPGPLRRRQQLHRLADRAGGDLAARLARPHAAGQHAGRVLAAAARRRARGRAGRGVARARRAGLVAAGPGHPHRQVPAQHAVGVPRRLARSGRASSTACARRSPTGSSRR